MVKKSEGREIVKALLYNMYKKNNKPYFIVKMIDLATSSHELSLI